MYVHMTPAAKKDALKQIIIDTMPTTAVASGFAPKPDHSQWMAPIIAQHPLRPECVDGGISRLMQWLTEQGIGHTYQQAKALQDHWIREFFRHSSRENPIVLG